MRFSASRVAVPISPNAEDPIHDTTLAPRSAMRGPRSIWPMCSSASLPSTGLRATPLAICWAWATTSPANETPGTTMRNSASATTRPATTFGEKRVLSQSCTGANTAYRTGIPTSPVA